MVTEEEAIKTPMAQNQSDPVESSQTMATLFSPGLKSLAAMAGWDEESILMASLIVEDTPDRDTKRRKRSDLNFKTPPSNSSKRKRRAHRESPLPISVPVIYLDEEEPEKQENQKGKRESKIVVKEEGDELQKADSGVPCSNSVLPCLDKLREELSCSICLEICFEPSTTSCGHSFCKKCLRSAADKCGKKCPKCRQLISNGRSCTVNTVLWNTIQLLFPQDVEARKAGGAVNAEEETQPTPETLNSKEHRRMARRVWNNNERGRQRRASQDVEDSALAHRVQREDLSRLSSNGVSGRNGRVENLSELLSRRIRRGTSSSSSSSSGQRMETLNSEEHWRLALRVLNNSGRGRQRTPSQDVDAALALRLQREEFMEAFR